MSLSRYRDESGVKPPEKVAKGIGCNKFLD